MLPLIGSSPIRTILFSSEGRESLLQTIQALAKHIGEFISSLNLFGETDSQKQARLSKEKTVKFNKDLDSETNDLLKQIHDSDVAFEAQFGDLEKD